MSSLAALTVICLYLCQRRAKQWWDNTSIPLNPTGQGSRLVYVLKAIVEPNGWITSNSCTRRIGTKSVIGRKPLYHLLWPVSWFIYTCVYIHYTSI
ncbi:hypothetical protein F5Y14DRAFT_409383 [Nemania sp. NC0429]|nr:hypothetical protein F5Y14DRAFT_409383 [Nemania sp. NC0429]